MSFIVLLWMRWMFLRCGDWIVFGMVVLFVFFRALAQHMWLHCLEFAFRKCFACFCPNVVHFDIFSCKISFRVHFVDCCISSGFIIWFIPWDAALHGSRSLSLSSLISAIVIIRHKRLFFSNNCSMIPYSNCRRLLHSVWWKELVYFCPNVMHWNIFPCKISFCVHFVDCRISSGFIIWFIPWDAALHGSRSLSLSSLNIATVIIMHER